MIVLVAIIAAAGGYIFSARKQKQYSASSAMLFVQSNFDQLLVGKQVVANNVDPARQAATNLSLVVLPTVARGVAHQLNLPTGAVIGDIAVNATPDSDVVKITATDPSPRLAAAIANAYVQQYISFRQAAQRSELTSALQLVNSQIAAIPADQQTGPQAQRLIQNRDDLELLAATQTGDAQQVQTATIPGSPSYPNPSKTAVIGLFIGLLAALVIVAILERLDRRIKNASEVDELYGVPVLGTVPDSGALSRRGAVGTPRDQDAFGMVRARLRYFDVDRDIKRVMVTSAESGEGKSIVSLNLARAAARANDKRVLLIEADMRLPSLTQKLGLDGVVGLGELLSQSHDLVSGLHELVFSPPLSDETEVHPQSNFDVLLSGAVPPNPVELLGSKRMAELLDYVESVYDIVIIDTPSVEVVSDAIPLVHQVDGVLVVCRVGHTRRETATRLMKQLRGLNANVLGVVINGVESNVPGYYGYNGRTGQTGRKSPMVEGARGGRA